jgi:hypothetical protein
MPRFFLNVAAVVRRLRLKDSLDTQFPLELAGATKNNLVEAVRRQHGVMS